MLASGGMTQARWTRQYLPGEDRLMKRQLLSALLLGAGLVGCGAASSGPVGAGIESCDADFELPIRLKAGGAAIRVESPGYAAPAWVDINGDGQMHLLVGQFRDGKIRVFKHLDAETFEPGDWLKAEGEVAEVPGVW